MYLTLMLLSQNVFETFFFFHCMIVEKSGCSSQLEKVLSSSIFISQTLTLKLSLFLSLSPERQYA